MATELIAASTDNTYNDGPSNFLVGSVVTMGPTQDIMDQMAASTFDTFLGMTHVNCVLCHNGRGHLDSINLWATNTTRYQAWQLASYMSRTSTARTPVDPSNNNIYYWSLLNNQRNFTTDYTLNTLTGNRPARVAPTGCKADSPATRCRRSTSSTALRRNPAKTIAPRWRATLPAISSSRARRSTTCGPTSSAAESSTRRTRSTRRGSIRTIRRRIRGRCSPPMPRLLNALAQHFIDSGYNVKALMREIVNSDTYQLSSRYTGTVECRLGALLRAQVRAPPVGRGDRGWRERRRPAVFPAPPVTAGACSVPGYTVNGWTDLDMGRPTLHDAVPRRGQYGGHHQRLPGQLPARQSRRPAAARRWLHSAGAQPDERALIENKLALTGATASPLMADSRDSSTIPTRSTSSS